MQPPTLFMSANCTSTSHTIMKENKARERYSENELLECALSLDMSPFGESSKEVGTGTMNFCRHVRQRYTPRILSISCHPWRCRGSRWRRRNCSRGAHRTPVSHLQRSGRFFDMPFQSPFFSHLRDAFRTLIITIITLIKLCQYLTP
jgi:hypothetical protein